MVEHSAVCGPRGIHTEGLMTEFECVTVSYGFECRILSCMWAQGHSYSQIEGSKFHSPLTLSVNCNQQSITAIAAHGHCLKSLL